MSDKPAPADCRRMILFREDLSGFVRAGDHAIEFQLNVHDAANIVADLTRFILRRHPHVGWPLAQQLWESAIAQLSDERLAGLVEGEVAATSSPSSEVPPYAH